MIRWDLIFGSIIVLFIMWLWDILLEHHIALKKGKIDLEPEDFEDET